MSAPDTGKGKPSEDAPKSPPPVLQLAPGHARGSSPRLQDPSSSVPNLPELLRALQRRLPLAIGAGLVCTVLASVAAWFLIPPAKYSTRATLQVAMFRPKIMFETGEVKADYRTFQRTQMALIKSRLVTDAVLQDPQVAKLETVQEVRRAQGDIVDWLEQRVMVEFPGNSEILQISMSGDRPNDLAVIVNSVVEQYMKQVVQEEGAQRADRVEKLRKLWDRYQADLKGKRNSLRSLAVAAGSDDRQTLALKNQFAIETLAQAKQEQLRIRSELARAKAEAAVLEVDESRGSTVPDEVIDEHVEKDPTVEQFHSRISTLTYKYAQVSRLTRSKTDPSLVAITRDLDLARKALAEHRAQLRRQVVARLGASGPNGDALERQRLAGRIKMLDQFEKELGKDVDRLSEQIGSLNEKTMDLQSEQDEIALLAETAKKVGAEVEAVSVELQAPDRIRVIDRAVVPSTKDEMKKARATGMVAVGTFACVLAGISFWEFRDRRISSVSEVVHGLGLPLVGSIPPLTVRTPRRLPGLGLVRGRDDQSHRSLMVESVEATRMMLCHASRTESLRIVMVTSALQGEGKTSLSTHLATSLARAGRRTLLIDCDLRSPTVHRLFDLPAENGVSELLRGEAEIADVIQPTRAPDLFVIAAGHHDARSIRALARGDLQAIFDALVPGYDFIIVDSAPVLPVADTLSVSQHVDAVIFSILHDVSRAPMVHTAYERLASLGVRILGAVVAGAPSEVYSTHYRYSTES